MEKPSPPAMRRETIGATLLAFRPKATPDIQYEDWAMGPMRCLRCHHKWPLRRKLPDVVHDCPGCGCNSGVPAGTFGTAAGNAVWKCNCGNTLMQLVVHKDNSEALLCVACGAAKSVVS
jgi:hypothetical protein